MHVAVGVLWVIDHGTRPDQSCAGESWFCIYYSFRKQILTQWFQGLRLRMEMEILSLVEPMFYGKRRILKLWLKIGLFLKPDPTIASLYLLGDIIISSSRMERDAVEHLFQSLSRQNKPVVQMSDGFYPPPTRIEIFFSFVIKSIQLEDRMGCLNKSI